MDGYWGLLEIAEVRHLPFTEHRPVEKVLQRAEAKRRTERNAVKADVLSWAEPWEPVAGLYFLIDGDEVVYVGRSQDVHKRVGEHGAQGKIEFDKVAVVEVTDEEHLTWMERNFLDWLQPKHNSRWRP